MKNFTTSLGNRCTEGKVRLVKNPTKTLFYGLLFVLAGSKAQAQLTATGQFRTRTELRSGQGTLSPEGAVPALFTSQRSRLNIGYSSYRYKFFTSIQDVRVWGQDASSINRTTIDANDGVMLNEA